MDDAQQKSPGRSDIDVRPRHHADQGRAVHRAWPADRPTRRSPSGIAAGRTSVAGRRCMVERCRASDTRTARSQAMSRDRHFSVGTRRRGRFCRARRHRHWPAVVGSAPCCRVECAERVADRRRTRVELRRGTTLQKTMVHHQRSRSRATATPRVVRERLPDLSPDRPGRHRPQQWSGRARVGRPRARTHGLYEPGAARCNAVGYRRSARHTRRKRTRTPRGHSRGRRRARRHLRERRRGCRFSGRIRHYARHSRGRARNPQ